jgi:hypothetical protein
MSCICNGTGFMTFRFRSAASRGNSNISRSITSLSAGSSSWKNIDIAPGAQSASRRSRQKAIQFLNEIGARGLRMHLGRVLEMAESSPDKAAYEQKINERFGMEQQRDLPIPTPLPAPTEAAN